MLITPSEAVAPQTRANGLSCLFGFWLLLIFVFTNVFVGFMAWLFIVDDSSTFTVFSSYKSDSITLEIVCDASCCYWEEGAG